MTLPPLELRLRRGFLRVTAPIPGAGTMVSSSGFPATSNPLSHMAIVDGKRILGVTFHKERGKRNWIAYSARHQQIWGLVVDYDGDAPMGERFHYCSPFSQPVFIALSIGRICRERYVDSSWRKMPEGWREIFRRDVFGG